MGLNQPPPNTCYPCIPSKHLRRRGDFKSNFFLINTTNKTSHLRGLCASAVNFFNAEAQRTLRLVVERHHVGHAAGSPVELDADR
jgi:hypothetical protein